MGFCSWQRKCIVIEKRSLYLEFWKFMISSGAVNFEIKTCTSHKNRQLSTRRTPSIFCFIGELGSLVLASLSKDRPKTLHKSLWIQADSDSWNNQYLCIDVSFRTGKCYFQDQSNSWKVNCISEAIIRFRGNTHSWTVWLLRKRGPWRVSGGWQSASALLSKLSVSRGYICQDKGALSWGEIGKLCPLAKGVLSSHLCMI